MSLNYSPVLWNKQKRTYDLLIAGFIIIYLIIFSVLTVRLNPELIFETLLIRAFGSLAFLMMTIILCIGPLVRLNSRLLPLLYNRRHLGVSMFLVASIHGIFSILHFHTLGDTNPIISVFTSNMDYNSLVHFPFQVLGFLALLILFFMASTSHDFWLANLGPRFWKALHMTVYFAFSLVIMHVFLGAFQNDTSWMIRILVLIGLSAVVCLHLLAAFKEKRLDDTGQNQTGAWLYVCKTNEIENNRAKITNCKSERVAVFFYDNQLSAVSNVCKHQMGPLGEGKIVDGCITCPWHGYQYNPHNGQTPPPFTEKISTYDLKVEGDDIYISVNPNPEGTHVPPVKIAK